MIIFQNYFLDIKLTFKNLARYYLKYSSVPVFRPLASIIKNLKDDEGVNDGCTLDRINELISYATKNSPYYAVNKSDYPTLSSLEDLKKLPVLKKETFRKNNRNFISSKSSFFNTFNFRTSGSTGTPLRGAIKLSDLKFRFKIFLTALKSQGIDYSRPLARFPGEPVGNKQKVYEKDFLNNHFLFSIYQLSNSKIYDYYKSLHENRIEIIEGYPSTIYTLVKLLKNKQLTLPHVKHIITTAEKLLEYQKEEIETFFNVRVFDYYGSSEGSVFMFSTHDGNYLNSNRIGYFECVDEDYQPISLGQSGRLLVTSFTSTFTPLIRYDIGDYATVQTANNEILFVKEILGRQEEIFISSNGLRFGRFSLFLKYLPKEVIESQLILTQGSDFAKLVFVSSTNLSVCDFVIFENKINSILGIDFIFTYEQIDKFSKEKRGKLSAVKIINDMKYQ